MASLPALLVVALCLVWLADSEDIFTEEEREFFKQLKFEQLPHELQLALMKKTRSGKSSWCCVNEKPIKSIQHSKVVSHTEKLTTQVKVGYKKCGFGGWKRCSTHDVRYYNRVTYSKAYYEVPDKSQCDEKDIRCCKNAVQVAGNCLDLAVAAKYLSTLKDLKDINLLDLAG